MQAQYIAMGRNSKHKMQWPFPISGTNQDPEKGTEFKDSQAAALRRLVRQSVKKAPVTKSERDIILYVANLWLYHRNGPRGYINPVRAQIAAKTDTSVRTVASVLAMLREAGVLDAVGGTSKGRVSTKYTLNMASLFGLCGCEVPVEVAGELAAVEWRNRANGDQNNRAIFARLGAAYIDVNNNTNGEPKSEAKRPKRIEPEKADHQDDNLVIFPCQAKGEGKGTSPYHEPPLGWAGMGGENHA